jgi:8-oxo-dGTP pyrophosphatase MutT (NUDIX family)
VNRKAVAENLRRFERLESRFGQIPAAVAIVILTERGAPIIPVFQRPTTMSRHPGQMALPGGRLHEGEDAEACAVRELAEELGLGVGAEDVLGKLDDFDTRSGFTMTPVVVWSGEGRNALNPSAAEVARLFLVPAPELREAVAAASQRPRDRFSLVLREVEIFAPTAAILYQFSEVALDGRSTRVADFHQPSWTHR